MAPTTRLATEPHGVDRLYPVSPALFDALRSQGLIDAPDGVSLRGGLLVQEDQPYRMPLGVYEAIAERGLLGPADRVTLLDGLLVTKMTRGDRHIAATILVWDALRALAGDGWLVKKEDPILLPGGLGGRDSVPEPDVSVVRGKVRDYLGGKPRPGDVALVVEVADTSLREDRQGLARYARAGLPVAWLVDLNAGAVEVHSRPGAGGYGEVAMYRAGDRVPVVLGGRELGSVAVADLLP